MSNDNRYDLQLRNLIRGLSRSIVEATDAEIQEDARLAGEDLNANAAQLKQMFLDASTRFRKRKFFEAQRAYETESRNLHQSAFQLPASAAERLALLRLVAAQQAQAGRHSLTAKFREYETLSDSDVTSLLEELAALGLLPNTPTNG